MRVRVVYCYRGWPVEVEVSGEHLQPEGVPDILGTILSRLNEWIESLQEEKIENEGLS